MLHEILLGLLGEIGGVIEEVNGVFQVREDCYFLNKSEQELINRILRVAGHYKYLERFSTRYGAMNAGLTQIVNLRGSDDEESPGLYLKALCRGIKDLLEEYRSKIASIEQEYLKGRTLTIPSLLDLVRNDELAAVAKIARQIETQRLRGGQLLDLVFKEEQCPALRDTMERMNVKLLQVFFHQLIAWTVYGNLLDSFSEFFVRQQEGDEWTSKYSLDLDMIPESCITTKLAEKALFIGKAVRVLGDSLPTEEAEIFAKALRQAQSNFSKLILAQILERMRKSVGNRLWNLVVVKSDLMGHINALKNYFLLSRGEFILTFLEESMDIMALPPKPDTAAQDINQGPFAQAQSSLEEDPYLTNFKLSIKQSGFTYNDFSSIKDLSLLSNANQTSKNSISLVQNKFTRRPGAVWHSRKQQIMPGFTCQFTFKYNSPCYAYLMLQSEKEISGQYSKAPISPPEIENGLVLAVTINEGIMRFAVQVNQLTVAESEKKCELTTIKVGLTYESDFIKVELNGNVCIDSQVNFQGIKLDVGTSAYIGIGSQTGIELLNWGFIQTGTGMQTAIFDSWSGLTLEYCTEWPLNLMLSPQILDKYMALFRFLFTLKRAQFTLQRSWITLVKKRNPQLQSMSEIPREALQLRAQMNFLLDNLISYLQLDIIQTQFTLFKKKVSESEDFEEVRSYHDQYVAKTAYLCFLQFPKIVKSIQEISRCCHELCGVMERGGDLKMVRTTFEQQLLFAFNVLSSLKGQHTALGQLLLRLNFNGYLTKLQKEAERPRLTYLR
ncbi:unnamed protein product [Blepharisma stoltei]|uniref:Spindle pole body component n=1 Tax=Blepharisma stoltei TaxID=1481888 RepID=A0AAU9KQ05_9CILI|nr:unnamed protein product [Blepharisma stoltei]